MNFTVQPLCRLILTLAFLHVAGQCTFAQTYTDLGNHATLTITSAPASLAGFTNYSFSVEPFVATTEITGVDASFSSISMNQINPGGSTPTIFSDNNFTISLVGEDPFDDSQFEFNSGEVQLLSSSESSTSLQAIFLLNDIAPAIQSSTPIAHIVLPDSGSGTLDLELSVRTIGVDGEGDKATFSNIPFGIASVPEPSMVLAWSLLAVGSALRRRRGSRPSQP